jgi:hypothetical protein
MPSRRATTTITMLVLIALLVAGGVVGALALFSPLPDDDPDTTATEGCNPGLAEGDRVRTRDVTVSVYNAGTRSGLAGTTRQRLVRRGFVAGEVGNAPGTLSGVQAVRVFAPNRNDPAARLVARQFGRGTRVQVSAEDLGPGVDVVVGNDFAGLVKAPRRITAERAGSGC